MAIIKPNNNTISAITALPASITTGKVLQVVSENITDYNQSNTSTTYADVTKSSSALELALTPSSSSNKIYVSLVVNFGVDGSHAQKRITLNVVGKIGSGSYAQISNNGFSGLYSGSTEPAIHFSAPFGLLWSPSTTSECKVKLQFKNSYTSSDMTSYINPNTTNQTSITLMEVAG